VVVFSWCRVRGGEVREETEEKEGHNITKRGAHEEDE
jgi:hypothetical protein